ncbi:hypothetical protein MHYP_G00225950 [Metynnis hypsauchen]
MAYRDEVQHLAAWCEDNNLALNTQKTKEIVVDFRRGRSQAHSPINISGAKVLLISTQKRKASVESWVFKGFKRRRRSL